MDDLLEGGLPVGAISELTGAVSSGRTSLALAFVSARTTAGQACAWVDAGDALDPESAAACGVALSRLLWVRCSGAARAGMPNRTGRGSGSAQPWTQLDQALRATDLLLQAGGFAAIVLDLGDAEPQCGNRIPLATWFRFRQAADRTRCSLVVLGRAAYAQSSAALVLACRADPATAPCQTVLRELSFAVESGRQRFTPVRSMARRPPASTWSACAPWDQEQSA